MENIVDELNYRGLIEQYSNEENVRKLLANKTTIYCGFDPSASSMHVGNYVMISILMRLQSRLPENFHSENGFQTKQNQLNVLLCSQLLS